MTTGQPLRSPAEIAAALRSDFAAEFRAQYDQAPAPDPVLTILFNALATQVGRVYQEAADVFPWQVLDDLMAGLGMPRPEATPAQVIVAATNVERRERLPLELRLQAKTPRGERMVFVPDASIELANTSIAFAAVAEEGRLQTVPGATLPDGVPLPTLTVSCEAASGSPALLLAFRCDWGNLSGLGLRVETAGGVGSATTDALARSPWYLLDADGTSRESGVLRSARGHGGINFLQFVNTDSTETGETSDAAGALAEVGRGPYGEQIWMFPVVPPGRRWSGAPPVRFEDAIHSMIPDGHRTVLERPLTWVYVPLPAGSRGYGAMIQGVTPNAVTASNLDVFEERVNFSATGTAVSLRPEGDGQRHVMRLLSVIGEAGTRYVPDTDLLASTGMGRVRMHGDIIELRPARRTGSRYDGWAKIRMLLCDGLRANGVAPGPMQLLERLGNVGVSFQNLTPSRGGSAPPDFSIARLRFADLLRTRERVVTHADLDIAAKAYDSRIIRVDVRFIAEVVGGGLQPVDLVCVTVPERELADPAADRLRLQHGLERHLSARAVIGRCVRVEVVTT